MDAGQIVAAFERIDNTLTTLCLHIHDDLRAYPVWVDNGANELISDRDKIIYALKHLQFSAVLKPQQTFACVGAVGATPDTFQCIAQVNQAKDAFKHAVKAYLAFMGHHDTAYIRQLLSEGGYPRMALKQVYRHIKLLPFHPRRISFTQAEHSSNRAITRQQAESLLLAAGQGVHIDIQLAKASLLAKNEKLVIRREIHDCWTANVATFKNEQGRCAFDKIITSLPLFYLHDSHAKLPMVVFSKTHKKRKRVARADKKSESTVFISSLSAYRYKKEV